MNSGSNTNDQMQVLVVDDDQLPRKIARESRERSGFFVHEAKDGPDALAILDRHIPDIILLDVDMPTMNGYDICSRVRAMPTSTDIPILIVKSRDDEASIERAYQVGATVF